MQTHPDHDFPKDTRSLEEKIESLQARAEGHAERGDAKITAGAPGEKALVETVVGNVVVKRLPADPDCTRVSIGGVPGDSGVYCVFRGNPNAVLGQLRDAIDALQHLRQVGGLKPR